MTVPQVEITKVDGQTGVVRPSDTGILAIVATAEKGDLNSPSAHVRDELAFAEFGWGALSEMTSYEMPASGKPALLVRGDPSTAAAYGSFTDSGSGGGISAITAGGTDPLDSFDVYVKFIAGGTVGSAGITYQTSLNGGQTLSATRALGTATSITIDGTGITIELGAGTIAAGRTVSFKVTGPKLTNADLPASLEVLRVTSSPWEAVLIDVPADADTVTLVDLWLKGMNARGRFKTAILTCRPRNAGESETQYKDALAAIFASSASTDIVVAADVGDVTSTLRGIAQPRPVGLAIAARGMKFDIGTDPAYISNGPVPGFKLTDARNNPKYHDEAKYPGLDDLRLSTLCSVPGKEGTFITNANILSSTGSDYVFWQHARVINRACELAFEILTGQLSRGVRKSPKKGPNGERYIDEADAQLIEQLVDTKLRSELGAVVDEIKFTISRTDDIRSNQGATITAKVEAVALAYIKKFTVSAGYVTEIVSASPGT